MARNPRISIAIDNDPTLTWKEVQTATKYTIKIIRKDCPGKPIVHETVNAEDLILDNDGFLKFMYPEKAARLQPLVYYEFTGVTNDGKEASGELIFLDSIRADIDDLIQLMEDSNVVTNPKILEKLKMIMEFILTPGVPKWFPKPTCIGFTFT